jgi:SAM-dependent methyltransferase
LSAGVRGAAGREIGALGVTPNELCLRVMNDDPSNGYEAVAATFIARRGTRPSTGEAIGAAIVRAWAEALPTGAQVLDLGCGPGEPTTRVLREAGLSTYAVDASPTMVAAFRERFPDVDVELNTVEASGFFGRQFDGVLAWGLLFLLTPTAQAHVISKVGRALKPGGRFLFTAHTQSVSWLDAMTGRPSRSLGAEVYGRLLSDAGMVSVGEDWDEGENHYYFAVRR